MCAPAGAAVITPAVQTATLAAKARRDSRARAMGSSVIRPAGPAGVPDTLINASARVNTWRGGFFSYADELSVRPWSYSQRSFDRTERQDSNDRKDH